MIAVETFRTRTGRTAHTVSVNGTAVRTVTHDPRTGMYVSRDGAEFRSLRSVRESAPLEYADRSSDAPTE